ncbi:MAG: holo-[acyl-carrier protein] synthase [Frankiales bacterium]|jgi:holo-[acyl-carrier protein] synthase|nr:holo-[acyl-carrier protein] synthase [Frankiales bacterium]
MIVGIGVDVVDVARFERSLQRTPRLADRLFTKAERDLPTPSLAARFAAKEAIAKALGAPGGLRWHDAEITQLDDGRPELSVRGTVDAAATGLGVHRWHISLSHDGGLAIAMVVAEG